MLRYIDNLTDLPNRDKLIKDLPLTNEKTLFLLNIDFFKEINNFFGNEFGNTIIKQLYLILKKFISKKIYKKNITLYKMTGGEFALLYKEIVLNKDITIFIKKLNKILDKKLFGNKEHSIYISISTGIATSIHGKTILSNANMALKQSKELKNYFVIYDNKNNLYSEYANNIKWSKKVKDAIKENRIVAFFQPIFNLKTNKIEKYESLIRLVDEKNNIISPTSFLDITKRTKFYNELTKKTIENSLLALSNHPNTEISINISYQDMLNEEIKEYLFNKLKSFPYTSKITLEILESERINDFPTAAEFLKQIKKYDIKIAIDDFGSGFSNFDYLLNLDVDYVKIDSSLIKNITKNKKYEIIVESIVFFCNKLNIKTVAEYVYNEEIFNKLKELNVDYAQGYYIGEPKKDF